MIRFRFAGTDVFVEFGFVAVCALLSAMENVSILACGFAAVIIHEMSHLIMMYLLDVRAESITFHFCGIRISTGMMCSYWRELVILLAGPFANIAVWLIFTYFIETEHDFFAQAQLVCGVMNLMPSRFLDGGAALCTIFRMTDISFSTGEKFLRCAFVFVPIILITAGIILDITNFTYYALMCYLLFSEILR